MTPPIVARGSANDLSNPRLVPGGRELITRRGVLHGCQINTGCRPLGEEIGGLLVKAADQMSRHVEIWSCSCSCRRHWR